MNIRPDLLSSTRLPSGVESPSLTNGGEARESFSTAPVAMAVTAERPLPPTRHLNQMDLSRRWRISPRTLERWRWQNQGPPYLKIGGRVVYRLEDVEAHEVAQRR